MSEANKNCEVVELGCMSEGYYGKVYAQAVQIFTPQGAPYIKLWDKSTEYAEQKARRLINLLNADTSTPSNAEEVSQDMEQDRPEQRIANIREELIERRVEMANMNQEIRTLKECEAWYKGQVDKLTAIIETLSDAVASEDY